MSRLAVIAIGGNSIAPRNQDLSAVRQQQAMDQLAETITAIQSSGYRVVLTHGNGPQVGLELQRAEIAHQHQALPQATLAGCVAATQGGMGAQLQLALANYLPESENARAISLVTLVEVAQNDPAFHAPDKPVGLYYNHTEYQQLAIQHPDWHFAAEAGKGHRRVIPSPHPRRILTSDVIASLLHLGHLVIAGGGGGVPVIRVADGRYQCIDGVIDKDLTSALLAREIAADLLVITTGVEHVCLNFATPQQKPLETVGAAEMAQYLQEGHFPAGSMKPKIEASLAFLRQGGKQVIITDLPHLRAALHGRAGTRILAG